MKKICILAAVLLFLMCGVLSAGNMENLNYINSLDGKKQALVSDAVKMFLLETGSDLPSSSPDYKALEKKGIKSASLYKSREKEDLKKGTLALFAAQYLDLGDSLIYDLLDTFGIQSERYAFSACAAAGIMPADGSAGDRISGSELLQIMTRVSEIKGGNR